MTPRKPKGKGSAPDAATLARTVLAGTINGKKYLKVLHVADTPAEAQAFAQGFNMARLWDQSIAFVGQGELDVMLGTYDPAKLESEIRSAAKQDGK